jgi:hypothetical protein
MPIVPGWSVTLWLLVLILTLSPPSLRAGEFDLLGVVWARGLVVEGQPAWLEGGFGRLTEGAADPQDSLATLRGALHLGIDWKPSETWLVHAHGVAQGEPASYGGRRVGLVEAYLQFRPELTPKDTLRLRAGSFFPPTSLENTEPLWQSPYTVTLSALNAWIGEEVRLTGLDASWIRKGDRDRLELSAVAFGVNDSSGALIGWRGWSLGDRLSTAGEVLPLPPLTTLEPGEAFGEQRDDGTRPVDELDSRLGYMARARWSRPEAFRIQAAFTHNRGDRRLHRGQYSWDTRFAQAGLELPLGKDFTLVAEGVLGDTGMGPAVAGGPRVDVRFKVGYALLSWRRGAWRVTARFDGFDNEDRDSTAEPGQESGWAATAALFWQPRPLVRLGAELLTVRADRPAAAFSGADPDTDTRRVLLELRLLF